MTNQCDKTIELELLPGLGEEIGCRKAKEKHETRAGATYRGKNWCKILCKFVEGVRCPPRRKSEITKQRNKKQRREKHLGTTFISMCARD